MDFGSLFGRFFVPSRGLRGMQAAMGTLAWELYLWIFCFGHLACEVVNFSFGALALGL